MNYGQYGNVQITSMSRNGTIALPTLVERVNNILSRFGVVASISPKCGANDDVFFVSGRRNGTESMMLIRWSLSDVNVDMEG